MFEFVRWLTTKHAKLAIIPLMVILALGAGFVRPQTAAATYNSNIECRKTTITVPAPRVSAPYAANWITATSLYRIVLANGTTGAWTKVADYPAVRAVPYCRHGLVRGRRHGADEEPQRLLLRPGQVHRVVP